MNFLALHATVAAYITNRSIVVCSVPRSILQWASQSHIGLLRYADCLEGFLYELYDFFMFAYIIVYILGWFTANMYIYIYINLFLLV